MTTTTRACVVCLASVAILAGLSGTAAASPGKRIHGFHQFSSPSGNIGCEIDNRFVRCDLASHSWNAPPKPASCDVDWVSGLGVGKHGKGYFVCAGDTAVDSHAPVLKYGHWLRDGPLKCTSRATGMTCKNVRTGHGFFGSRERYRIF
jgi:hypothetical protein